MLSLEDFFAFERFLHRSLWEEGRPVWQALQNLDSYLGKILTYRIEVEIPPGVYLERSDLISIGEGTILEPGVFLAGPCVIGKGCKIRHGAYLREGVICGNRCTIGHATEVKHSILFDGASAAHFCYVGDSILGNDVNLGAGVKCANLRFDRREISIDCEGKKVATGLKKLGGIVGDRVQIGCNCVLNPGTLIGMDAVSFPLMNLQGYIPQGYRVKREVRAGEKILEQLLK